MVWFTGRAVNPDARRAWRYDLREDGGVRNKGDVILFLISGIKGSVPFVVAKGSVAFVVAEEKRFDLFMAPSSQTFGASSKPGAIQSVHAFDSFFNSFMKRQSIPTRSVR